MTSPNVSEIKLADQHGKQEGYSTPAGREAIAVQQARIGQWRSGELRSEVQR